jgi:WD40 repeat protein
VVRDVRAGRDLHRLRPDGGWVHALLFDRDGRRLAAGGGDNQRGEVTVWDADSGREVFARQTNAGEIRNVQFSPDGRHLLATGWYRGNAESRVWDLASGEERRVLRRTRPGGLLFAPGGELVDWDGGRARDVATGSDRWNLPLESRLGRLAGVVLSPDGARLGTVEVMDTPGRSDARLWDADSGRGLARLQGHADQVLTLCFSRDGKRVATGGDDKNVILWDADSGKPLWTGRGHALRVVTTAFGGDGREVVSASADGVVCVWDAATGVRVPTAAPR